MNRSGGRMAVVAATCLVVSLALPAGWLSWAGAADLTGRLLAGDGKPAAKTPVYLHPDEGDTPVVVTVSGQTGNNASLVRDYRVETDPAETKTDAQGRFRFAGVAAGTYILRVPRRSGPNEHYVEELEPIKLAVGQSDANLGNIPYQRCGAYVAGTLRIDGKPFAGANVRRWSRGLGPMREHCTSDSRGRYRLYLYDVPAAGMKVDVVASEPGRAAMIQQVGLAPWSEAKLDFDLKSSRYGTVVGITRPIMLVRKGNKVTHIRKADPGALVYICPAGKGRGDSPFAPVQLGEARFTTLIPPGQCDLHLVRPGHAAIVKTVRVRPGRTVRVWLRAPVETPLAGKVKFTLDGAEIDYDMALSFVEAPAVRLVGRRQGLSPKAFVDPDGAFALAAPGAGTYRIEVHQAAVTNYGPGMLERLGTSRNIRVKDRQPVEIEVKIDLMPILRQRVQDLLAMREASPGVILAGLRWQQAQANQLAAAGKKASGEILRKAMQSLMLEASRNDD